MQHEVTTIGKQFDVAAQHFTHAALDAVALMGFAEHLAGRKSNARRTCGNSLGRKKPAHRRRLSLARIGVDALIVGVLLQADACERLTSLGKRNGFPF